MTDNRRMSWNEYHRLDVIYHFMDDLSTKYPKICSIHEIGKSVEGRTLMVSVIIFNTTVIIFYFRFPYIPDDVLKTT